MTITRRIKQFISEVATMATHEPESDVTMKECINEYTDQILTDDFACVVYYAEFKGIKIPPCLMERVTA